MERQQMGQLAQLQKQIAQLSFEANLDALQEAILAGACRVLGVESAVLVLLDEAGDGLATCKGMHADGSEVGDAHLSVRLPQDAGLVSECLHSGQALQVDDVAADERFFPESDALLGLIVRAMACAPLLAGQDMLGALVVYNPPAGFSTTDLDLLTTIAGVAAQAVYGTYLIQQHKIVNADLEASRWELLRSRNTLRALFDSFPAALYIIDRKYQLVALNLFCAQRTGESPNQLVGRRCYEALYGRQEICPGCKVAETLLSGERTERSEHRWHGEEDSSEWDISTYPIYDEQDRVVQAILLEQDVTERHRLENILAQSEKLAAVGQLAAGVAHEINNPLTAIIANAQMLQRELPPDDELQESIDLIARAGARATQVVRNLLDFARKEHYHMTPININETLRRALALVQHEVLAHDIQLSFNADPDLPLVLASQDHLQGVWLNLLMNAIDAIEDAGGEVRVKTYRKGSDVYVWVSDNGKGISSERLARIFEPFYTTKAPGRGTGLGLSVCERIIKQHGGQIEVQSALGKGSQFTVRLPISSK